MKDAIYQTQDIRHFEHVACEQYGLSPKRLMERAGQAAFNFLLQRWPHAKKILIFCGGGNNGGDGYTLAKLAHEHGLNVSVLQVGDSKKLKGEAKDAFEKAQLSGLPIYPFQAEKPMDEPDLIVDAICGIGLTTALRDEALLAVSLMEEMRAPLFAIDIPTGVNADTGQVINKAVKATVTMTFIGLKLGLFTGAGVSYAGQVVCDDLQLPEAMFAGFTPAAYIMKLQNFQSYLKPRPRDWHKGLSGHVLIIGGACGFSGAARLSALAALRVGAGLVSVATYPDHADMLNLTCPEIMCHGIAQAEDLMPLLNKADVIVLGPGLQQSSWSQALWTAAINTDTPLVVDADALNLLAKTSLFKNNWILTPHPGEAARLLHVTTQEIQQDRLLAADAIQKRYGGTCVLKGAGSLIISEGNIPALCDKGNPGMASAGMGDILSGVMGGLVAQNIPLIKAAELGVLLHALAGDLAAQQGARGMIATDLLPYLRKLCNYEEESL